MDEKISESVENILEFFEQCRIGYNAASEEVETENKRLQDLLHMIEFEPSGKERNKIATKLKNSRVYRRQNKDMMEVLEPIIEFLDKDSSKKALNLLKEALGAVRKAEQRQENRVYYPRVEGDVIH